MSQARTYEMIHLIGPERALAWYLQWGIYPPCPDAVPLAQQAIDACADDDGDRILYDDQTGDEMARAFQLVQVFDLGPFVNVAVQGSECPPDDGP